MANQLGSQGVSPRSHSQHQRHRKLAGVRAGSQFSAFLAAQATRLSRTSAQIFAYLPKNTAARVKQVAVYTSLK